MKRFYQRKSCMICKNKRVSSCGLCMTCYKREYARKHTYKVSSFFDR
jgi:hypothetical protein